MTDNLALAAFTTAGAGIVLWIWCATAWYTYAVTSAEIEPVYLTGLGLVTVGAAFAIVALARIVGKPESETS